MLTRSSFALLVLLNGAAQAAEVVCPAGTVSREEFISGGPAAWCELANGSSLFHGPYRAWHPNGFPGIEENYVQGKANGRAAYWWASGNKQAEGNYRDGIRDGVWTFWDKNGVIEGKVRFVDGRPVSGRLPRWAEDWDGMPAARRNSAHR